MSDSKLIDAWRGFLQTSNSGLHLADPAHILQILVGKTDLGLPRMVIRSSVKPVKPTLSDLVLVERFEDHSKKWHLSFTLQDEKFTEVFLRLAGDVHARSARAPSEAAALDCVSKVIGEWWRLLKPCASGLLTMEELRGLIGELSLLLAEFSASRPMDAAVEGWLGPMGLPQDFWYADSGYHEVKAIGPSMTEVRISSETQLDADPLHLLVLRVASAAETSADAVNLPGLAGRVHTALTELGASPDAFDARLRQLGVKLDEPFYQDTWFVVGRLESYAVTSEFPAIRKSQLDPRVKRVRYQLEVSALSDFLERYVAVN